MVTSSSENGRYFKTNRVNPINLYIFKKTFLRDKFNGTKHYGILSENLSNSVVSIEHKLGYKSNHILILLKIDVTQHTRGPGYFELNNSLLLDSENQEQNKKNINEVAFNTEANTLWELIKRDRQKWNN